MPETLSRQRRTEDERSDPSLELCCSALSGDVCRRPDPMQPGFSGGTVRSAQYAVLSIFDSMSSLLQYLLRRPE